MNSLWIAIGDNETVLEIDGERTIIKNNKDALVSGGENV